MIKKCLALLKYDLKSWLGPLFVFVLAAPVAAAFLLSVSFGADILKKGAVEPFSIALVSGTDERTSEMISSVLKTVEIIDKIEYASIDKALEMLEYGRVKAVISLPDDIVVALESGNGVALEVYGGRGNPVENAIIKGFGEQITASVTEAQSAVYAYYDAARGYFDGYDEFQKPYERFVLKILLGMLQRSAVISVEQSIYGYSAHLVFMMIFLCCAVGAVFIASICAKQFADGTYPRLFLSGVRWRHFITIKVIENALLCLLMNLPLVLIFRMIDLGQPELFKAVAVAELTSIFLFSVFMLFAVLLKNQKNTIVSGFAAALLLLLVGGGIYPLYLLGELLSGFGKLTPAYYSLHMTLWSLGGDFPNVALIYIPAAAIVLCACGAARRHKC